MQDCLLVRCFQSVRQLCPIAQNLGIFHRPGSQSRIQRDARNQLHHQEVHSAFTAEFVHSANMWMVKLGE